MAGVNFIFASTPKLKYKVLLLFPDATVELIDPVEFPVTLELPVESMNVGEELVDKSEKTIKGSDKSLRFKITSLPLYLTLSTTSL